MKHLGSLLVAYLLAIVSAADPVVQTNQLAIDANEDALTATLTYRGATVDIFGHADDLSSKDGRLAISVIGPEVPQNLRILERNAVGMVTQGAPKYFEHLPGFWALHATPASTQLADAANGEFERLPAALMQWAFKQVDVAQTAPGGFGGNALQAQILDGSLSVNNAVNLRDTGLFNTTLILPASAPVGQYEITAHWISPQGVHMVSVPKTLVVAKGPIARWIENTSINQALLYGLICVFLAIGGGLLSEIVFRRFAP